MICDEHGRGTEADWRTPAPLGLLMKCQRCKNKYDLKKKDDFVVKCPSCKKMVCFKCRSLSSSRIKGKDLMDVCWKCYWKWEKKNDL